MDAVNYSVDVNTTAGFFGDASATELPVSRARISDTGGLDGMINSTQLILMRTVTNSPTNGYYSAEIAHGVNSTAVPKDEG